MLLLLPFLILPARRIMKMLNSVFQATMQHSRNLGLYVALFKFVQCVMRHVTGTETPLNTVVGGLVGGFVMFGNGTPINSQINMYVFSRVFFGICRTAVNKGWASESPYAYPAFASATWAAVMYLFYHQEGTLQKSLIGSMTYLYQDSDQWPENATNPLDWFMQE